MQLKKLGRKYKANYTKLLEEGKSAAAGDEANKSASLSQTGTGGWILQQKHLCEQIVCTCVGVV